MEELLSMYLGPSEILLAATLEFKNDISGRQISEASNDMLKKVQAVEPRVFRLFLRADCH
jgi:hypothetical protein